MKQQRIFINLATVQNGTRQDACFNMVELCNLAKSTDPDAITRMLGEKGWQVRHTVGNCKALIAATQHVERTTQQKETRCQG